MELRANIPAGPARAEVEAVPLRDEAGQSGEQAQVHGHRGRLGPGRGAAAPPRWPNSATTSSASATRTRRAGPTRSPRRAASTPPRTTATTATASSASSTTRSRAATSAPARPTSTGWPRSRSTSSTSAWPRACRSPASTAACSTTAPSAARRSRAPSMRAARPASSSCWAPTRRWSGRSGGHGDDVLPRTRCSTWSWSTAGRAASSCATWSPARSRRTSADAVVLATGGYGNVFYLSTNANGCNVTAIWRAYKTRRRASPTRATPRSTRPASRSRASTSRSSR